MLGEARSAGQRFDSDPVVQEKIDGGSKSHESGGVDEGDFSMGTGNRAFDHGCDETLKPIATSLHCLLGDLDAPPALVAAIRFPVLR